MATIKSTIKIETGSLLATPITIAVAAVEQVNQNANVSTVDINANSSKIIYNGTVYNPSNVVYFYCQATSSNTAGVEVYLTTPAGVESLIALLAPNDFVWLPIAAYSVGTQVRVNNLNELNSATVTYFYGERG
jgi:hypothetical protein